MSDDTELRLSQSGPQVSLEQGPKVCFSSRERRVTVEQLRDAIARASALPSPKVRPEVEQLNQSSA